MENLLRRATDLLKIKSIITLMTMTVFTIMALTGKIDTDNVMMVVGMVVTYFFAKQDTQKDAE